MLDLSPAIRLSHWLHARRPNTMPRQPARHPAPHIPEELTMTLPELRPCTRGDQDACVAIWRAASEVGHPFLTASELDADEALVREVYMHRADITVAWLDGRPAGFIALGGDFIGALFVSPRHHRRGIGRCLLEHAARSHPRLEVEVYLENLTARRFYRAAGFRETLCMLSDDQGRPHRLIRMERAAASARRDA